MRKTMIFLPLLLGATPAVAQDSPQAMKISRELTDPESAMKLAAKLQTLSNAVLNIRVGDLGAALEGRDARPSERNATIGDLIRRKDPEFDRHIQEQVASVGPKVMQGMQTLQQALPRILHDVDDVQRSLKRATSNLPDPTYPAR